jgi:hypothetical protein
MFATHCDCSATVSNREKNVRSVSCWLGTATQPYLFRQGLVAIFGITYIFKDGIPDAPVTQIVAVVECGHFFKAVYYIERFIFIWRFLLNNNKTKSIMKYFFKTLFYEVLTVKYPVYTQSELIFQIDN